MVPTKSYKDLWKPEKAAVRRSSPQSSVINMEHVDKKPELLELVEKVHSSYNIVTKTMNDNKDYLERTFNDLSLSYNILAREMAEDAETMERVLKSAELSDDPSVTNHLLEQLKNCFNAPSHWLMEVMVKAKRKQLTEAHQILKNYLTAKRGEATKVRLIFNDYLRLGSPDVNNNNISKAPSAIQPEITMVNVTFITNPGHFYILQWSELKEFNRLFTELQELAPTSPVPDDIIKDQVYAVLTNEKEWHRATVGLPSGTFQVGDDPVEPLFKCFFLDDGQHQRIPKSSIRVLPKELMELPPFAKLCTLNANFRRRNWSPEMTAMFKQWTNHGPLNMKVINEEESVLYVDLFRLDEGCQMVSVKDSLINTARRVPLAIEEPLESRSSSASIKIFKPKFESLQLQSNPLKYASVIITKAVQPKDVYIQVEDEDIPRYLHMQKDLQAEFRSATRRSESYCPSPSVDQPYVVQFDGTQWYRAIVETYHRQAKVFFIDIGHRQTIEPTMSFHKLPNRFLELPAQAIRCSLQGVFPPSQPASFKGRKMTKKDDQYPQEIFTFMPRYEGKRAVAIFEHWNAGNVGHSPKTAELLAGVILYPHGETHSINVQVGETSMARQVRKQLEIPEHYEIREKLAPSRSIVPSSPKNQVAASSRPISIRDLPPKNGSIPRLFTLFRVMSWKPAEIPKVGAKFNAKVTWVNKNGDIFMQNTRSERELDAIRLHLNEKYKDSVSTENDLLCAPGDLCVAKYDNDWYRCTIKTVNQNEVVVYYDDFGNLDVVDIKDIRLDIALLDTPVQVLRCSLHNLQPVGGAPEWSSNQRNFIYKEAVKWTFRAVVKAPGPQVMLMYKRNSCFNTDVVHNRCADFVESSTSNKKAK